MIATVRRLFASRKARVALNAGFALVVLLVSALGVRHFVDTGWPFHSADPILVSAAVVLFLLAYAFKAYGWQRLFAEHERPAAGALAAAGGAACLGGIALPGRLDDA